MATESVDVLIVGGGPAGMVAGCLLARAGLQVLVVERNRDFEREFRGEILQPRFHRAMRDVGLFDHIASYPHEEIDAAHIYFHGLPIGRLNVRRLDRRAGTTWWMTQPELLRALHDYGKAFAGFNLWFDAQLAGWQPGSAEVERAGEPVTVRAKVIIGADGRYSSMRRLGDFRFMYDHLDLEVIWFLLPRPERYAHIFSFFLSLRHNYLILPKHPNQLQCGMVLRPGEFAELRKHLPEFRDELRRAHPVFTDFAEGLTDFSPFRPLKGDITMVETWARDGAVLVGDSAHTCSPAGGIGVAIAVETACVAADVILRCFAKGDFSQESLNEIQILRMDDVMRVHRFQHNGGRAARAPAMARLVAPLVFPTLTLSGLFPVIARQVLTQSTPLPLSDAVRV